MENDISGQKTWGQERKSICHLGPCCRALGDSVVTAGGEGCNSELSRGHERLFVIPEHTETSEIVLKTSANIETGANILLQ